MERVEKVYILLRKNQEEFMNNKFFVGGDNRFFKTYCDAYCNIEDGSVFLMFNRDESKSGENCRCKVLKFDKQKSVFNLENKNVKDDYLDLFFEEIFDGKIIEWFNLRAIRNSVLFNSKQALRQFGKSFIKPILIEVKDFYKDSFINIVSSDDFNFNAYEKTNYLILENKVEELLNSSSDRFVELYVVKDDVFIEIIEINRDDKNNGRKSLKQQKDLNKILKIFKDNYKQITIKMLENILNKFKQDGWYREDCVDSRFSLYSYLCANTISEKYENYNESKNIVFNNLQKEEFEIEEDENISDTSDLRNYKGNNTIFYGVPGCGKSFRIKKLLENIDCDFLHL